jgi:molybdopterin-containing oxidoreductase family iron-sulfur binding subunit
MSEKEKGKSRRKFLKTGITAGISAAAGLTGGGVLASKAVAGGSARKVKALTTDGKVIEVDEAMVEEKVTPEAIGRKESMEGIPNRKFVMVVDLAKCKNARA